jgi:Tripartite tricarboxylate transporter TctB family
MPNGLTDSKQAEGAIVLRDKIGGGVLVLIGVYVVATSLGYRLGTLARMGPGMLPLALGVLLVLFGILVALFVKPEPGEAPPVFRWRPWSRSSLPSWRSACWPSRPD